MEQKYTLSTHIAHLQRLLELHGDIQMVYSRDDEGNGYQILDEYNVPVFGWIEKDDPRPETFYPDYNPNVDGDVDNYLDDWCLEVLPNRKSHIPVVEIN